MATGAHLKVIGEDFAGGFAGNEAEFFLQTAVGQHEEDDPVTAMHRRLDFLHVEAHGAVADNAAHRLARSAAFCPASSATRALRCSRWVRASVCCSSGMRPAEAQL
jgi:hypothetical protein